MKMAILISTLGVISSLCCSSDFRICTDDSKIVVDDIFLIAESIEQNPWTPAPEVFKNLLAGLQKLLGECFSIQVDLAHYDSCVDEVLPALPLIKKLVEDIKNGSQSEILIDITHIALALTDAITHCLNRVSANFTNAPNYPKNHFEVSME